MSSVIFFYYCKIIVNTIPRLTDWHILHSALSIINYKYMGPMAGIARFAMSVILQYGSIP